MTLTRVIAEEDPYRRGRYRDEVAEFVNTGWAKAVTDIYPDKNPQTKLMGFKNGIKVLGVEGFVKVVYEHGQFYLERY